MGLIFKDNIMKWLIRAAFAAVVVLFWWSLWLHAAKDESAGLFILTGWTIAMAMFAIIWAALWLKDIVR